MSAILGYVGLGLCLLFAVFAVYYNVIMDDNITPTILGTVWGNIGQGGVYSQAAGIPMMFQWGRFILPMSLVVFGIGIWYVECVVYGDSSTRRY